MKKINDGKPEDYRKHLESISGPRLYSGLLNFGLFPDRIPSILNSEGLSDALGPVTKEEVSGKNFETGSFLAERDIVGTRIMQLPNPVAYAWLCQKLKEHWKVIRGKLISNTVAWPCCISTIHLRPMSKTKALFAMNYHNYRKDDDAMTSMLFGAKYRVKCDISSFFPSVYTHTVSWAMVGRPTAKKMHAGIIQKNAEYLAANAIDSAFSLLSSYETKGIPIGPHASNLLSEILLTSIDDALAKEGFLFVRAIDDYTCFAESREEADSFVLRLDEELRKLRLAINHKKTSVEQLPILKQEWPLKIDTFLRKTLSKKTLDFKDAQEILGVIANISDETGSLAPYKYFLTKFQKVRANLDRVTFPALKLLANSYYSVAYWHSYLLPSIGEWFFGQNSNLRDDMSPWCGKGELEKLFEQYLKVKDSFGLTYVVAIAIENNIRIVAYEPSLGKAVLEMDDMVLLVLGYAYAKKYNLPCLSDITAKANEMIEEGGLIGDKWLFVYEAGDCAKMRANSICPPLERLKAKEYTFIAPFRDGGPALKKSQAQTRGRR